MNPFQNQINFVTQEIGAVCAERPTNNYITDLGFTYYKFNKASKIVTGNKYNISCTKYLSYCILFTSYSFLSFEANLLLMSANN